MIPVEIDYNEDFGPSDKKVWNAEYEANIKVEKFSSFSDNNNLVTADAGLDNLALPYDFLDEFEEMSPAERQFVLDELAAKPDLWDQEQEVMCL